MAKVILSEDQIRFVATKIAQWLAVLADNGHYPPTEADCTHSALLYRLLSGKEPLPKPPPLMFSYPAYRLAEGERVMLLDPPKESRLSDEGDLYNVVVEQHLGYKWINKDSGILEYKDGSRYRVFLAPWKWKGINGTSGVEQRWHMQLIAAEKQGEQQELVIMEGVK